jgi:dTDP-L-rhamnose 4-epimerase
MKVLITGGAGFIGRHVARICLANGDQVTILDNFSPQIHGNHPTEKLEQEFREFLGLPQGSGQGSLTIIPGDVTDLDAWQVALPEQEAVIHLAAETGTGQSMYEVTRYEKVNLGGTAALFQSLIGGKFPKMRKVILSSSRAIYGEGKYLCPNCGPVQPQTRSVANMTAGQFEPCCAVCQSVCSMLPTDEKVGADPTSYYGLTKQVQETTVNLFARTLGLSAFVLRYQNVYGPTQSLRNPYTGILAIFSNLARSGQPINIFEDGKESRDFVYVDDVARATYRCLDTELTGIHTLNIGSGEATLVNAVVKAIVEYFNSASSVTVTGQFRIGDIRHNVADIALARKVLDFEPKVLFSDGIKRFLSWAVTQPLVLNQYQQSLRELREKGLMLGGAEEQGATRATGVNRKPMFSLLIPSYNRPEYLKLAIESILSNTCPDFEIVVSDDKSPRANEIASMLAVYIESGKVRYFAQQHNLGWSDNRNFLISKARGNFVVLLGDDDMLLPHSLERLAHHILLAPEHDLYTFGFSVIDGEGRHKYSRRAPHSIIINSSNVRAEKELLISHVLPFWVCHPFTLCYREEVGHKVRYDKTAGIGDDLMFLIEAANLGLSTYVIPETLFLWRRLDGHLNHGKQPNLSGSVEDGLFARFRIYAQLVARIDLAPRIETFVRGDEYKRRFLFQAVDLAGLFSDEQLAKLLASDSVLYGLLQEYRQRHRRQHRVAIRIEQLRSFIGLFDAGGVMHLLRSAVMKNLRWR